MRYTAAHAIAGASPPYAAPSDVGAVHHDTSPMRTTLGERDYCFFVVRRVSGGNLELTPGHSWRGGSACDSRGVSAVVRSITRSTRTPGRISPRRRLPIRNFVDVVLLTSVH